MVKARMRFWAGKWWCRRMGVTGCGRSMEDAYEDMWNLYKQDLFSAKNYESCAPRA